jgi:hypothetical protein
MACNLTPCLKSGNRVKNNVTGNRTSESLFMLYPLYSEIRFIRITLLSQTKDFAGQFLSPETVRL